MRHYHLSFLVFEEGNHWVAQCIEYNIATQARTLNGIIPEIRRTVLGTIAVRAYKGLPGIESLPPPPERYRRAFDEAVATLEPLRWPDPDPMMPPPTLRVGELTRA